MSSNINLNNGLQQIRSSVQRFHRNDSGQSTMEIILLLFIAGIVIVFLTQGGSSITEKVNGVINEIMNFNIQWGAKKD